MLNNLINQYVEILDANYGSQYNRDVKFSIKSGRKYTKVVFQGSVHAFIDVVTGDVYKPASWAQPAKGARYNLFRDIETLRKVADWAGGYLYR